MHPDGATCLDTFDCLTIAFLNIGNFYGHNDGSTGAREPEYFSLSQAFNREHHGPSSSRENLRLKKLEAEIPSFKNEEGVERIAKALGIVRPVKLH